jgi:hypothetical protein
VGRAGLLHDPEQGALAQYFKTKKTSSELVVFSYLKTLWGEQDFASQHPS